MRLTAVLILACLAGCASQPQAPQTKVAAATPAPPAAPVQAEPAQQAAAQQGTNEAFKPPGGYRMKKRGAETVYCKKDTILGSRFPEEFCYTEQQLKEIAQRGEDQRLNKDKISGICGGATGACGNE